MSVELKEHSAEKYLDETWTQENMWWCDPESLTAKNILQASNNFFGDSTTKSLLCDLDRPNWPEINMSSSKGIVNPENMVESNEASFFTENFKVEMLGINWHLREVKVLEGDNFFNLRGLVPMTPNGNLMHLNTCRIKQDIKESPPSPVSDVCLNDMSADENICEEANSKESEIKTDQKSDIANSVGEQMEKIGKYILAQRNKRVDEFKLLVQNEEQSQIKNTTPILAAEIVDDVKMVALPEITLRKDMDSAHETFLPIMIQVNIPDAKIDEDRIWKGMHSREPGNEKEQFYCRICRKNFQQLYKLKNHAKIHFGEVTHKCLCLKCGVPYRDYRTMRRHHNDMHKMSTD